MSNFKSDLEKEKILSEYLDKVYLNKQIEFKRIFDLEQQQQGIDVIMYRNNKQYLIDEKAQLHYINSDLPTFTFELSYLKNGFLKEGWLFDSKKLTQYYLLITGIFLKASKKELKTPNDIAKIKITSVNRRKLIKHLASIELNKENLLKYDTHLRKNKLFDRNPIPELDATTEGILYFTKHLEEKPINLQLRLKYLIEKGVAQKFYYV